MKSILRLVSAWSLDGPALNPKSAVVARSFQHSLSHRWCPYNVKLNDERYNSTSRCIAPPFLVGGGGAGGGGRRGAQRRGGRSRDQIRAERGNRGWWGGRDGRYCKEVWLKPSPWNQTGKSFPYRSHMDVAILPITNLPDFFSEKNWLV